MKKLILASILLIAVASAYSQNITIDDSGYRELKLTGFDFSKIPGSVHIRIKGQDYLPPEEWISENILLTTGEVVTLAEFINRKDAYSK